MQVEEDGLGVMGGMVGIGGMCGVGGHNGRSVFVVVIFGDENGVQHHFHRQ